MLGPEITHKVPSVPILESLGINILPESFKLDSTTTCLPPSTERRGVLINLGQVQLSLCDNCKGRSDI